MYLQPETGYPSSRCVLMEGILNCRDLGGIPLSGNGVVAPGKLLRSGRLSNMTPDDAAILQTRYHLSAVVDLRSHREMDQYPNKPLPGAKAYPLPLMDLPLAGITRENANNPVSRAKTLTAQMKSDGARGLLCHMYPSMVTDPGSVAGIARFFRILLQQQDGAVLWHCTAGKDRTGVVSAILLRLLGANREDIVQDYLLTNEQTGSYRKEMCRYLLSQGLDEETVEQMNILESVDRHYIDLCFSRIQHLDGSFDAFVKNRLCLTMGDREKLMELYCL